MRVIAGSARSLPLKTVPTADVRPTTDKTKETLFNILSPYVEGSRFLDLYAGSGAIGIEALSRGASRAVFVERSRDAWKCIEENLRFTRLGDRASLIRGDVMTALRRMEGLEVFDLIFMDPPYEKGMEQEALAYLSDSALPAEDAILVVEASKFTELSYVNTLGFEIWKERIYKKSCHLFLKRRSV